MPQLPTWRKEPLPNGAIAYLISRKNDPEKPCLIHFGFASCTLAICGLCMCARLFKPEKNLEDVESWCLNHWQNQKECGGYGKGVLRRVIAESIGAKSTRQNVGTGPTGTPRNLLLPESWLKGIFGETLLTNLKKDTQGLKSSCLRTVCNKCLTFENQPGCCVAKRMIEVVRIKTGRIVAPVYCTDDEKLLAEEAAIVAGLSASSRTVLSTSVTAIMSPLLLLPSFSESVFRAVPCSPFQDHNTGNGYKRTVELTPQTPSASNCFGNMIEAPNTSVTGPFHISVASLLMEHAEGLLSARETLEGVRQLLIRDQWGRKRIRLSISDC